MSWKRAQELRKSIAWDQAEEWQKWVRVWSKDHLLRRLAQTRYFFWYAKWVTGTP